MSITIHPYKGYLNTKFNIYAKSVEHEINVFKMENEHKELIRKDKVLPNIPYDFIFNTSGKYRIIADDGEEIDIHVEDGYKFGGSTLKRSFIFDNNPWCFVIMYDRTYFYNRDTQRTFVEPISPDKISIISKSYILFENDKSEEKTIFSLDNEKPILCVSNIVTYNENFIAWTESNSNKKELCIFPFISNCSNRIDRYEIDNYILDESNTIIIYYYGNDVFRIYTDIVVKELTVINEGKIVGIVSPNIVVTYWEDHRGNILYLKNIDNGELINKIEIEGHLAEFNGFELIDVRERQLSLDKIDFVSLGIPDATTQVTYHRIVIYVCEWDIFYTNKTIKLTKTGARKVERSEKNLLCSINKGGNVSLKNTDINFKRFGDAVLLYNDIECYTTSKKYSGSGYLEHGHVYFQNGFFYLYKESYLYKLSYNGYWDDRVECDWDYEYFSKFGIVKDKRTDTLKTINGKDFGKRRSISYIEGIPFFIQTDNYYIFSHNRTIKSANLGLVLQSVSENLSFGISVTDDGVYLCKLKNNQYVQELIMHNNYDINKYHNVLLSEDGKCMLYRAGDISILMNIENGETQNYSNLSYIKQINGIRPLFEKSSSLQPRLINPITGQYIDCEMMNQYQFISPDGEYYADTRLNEYIEYFNKETGGKVSQEEYMNMVKTYSMPWNKGSKERKEVTEKRKQLILDNFNYLNKCFPSVFKKDRSEDGWKYVLDLETNLFLEYMFDKKGIAIIRKTSDNSEYIRIDLGSPLEFINYVAFSHDSKYVAIAGYKSGGLLIIYDLKNRHTIIHEDTPRAVWNVAFSAKGAFASYTSDPYTFFAEDQEKYNSLKERILIDRNFLTFSPDGEYFALSRQGYISKYDEDGNTRDEWGHQPSYFVEIRNSSNKEKTLMKFYDLGGQGISGVSTGNSVASVSFSNDNTRLMMVGNDGVVIIRNLKINTM